MGKDYAIIAFAVVDTNVVVSSLLGNKPSYTKDVMCLVEKGNIILLYDERILDEYQEVLGRFFTDDVVNEKMKMLIEHGYLVKSIEETRELFKDRDDIPFFEVKETARELSPYLVTKNTKDFPPGTTDLPEVVIRVLSYLDSFIVKDKETYLEEMKRFIDSMDKEKYIKGIDSGYVEKYILPMPQDGYGDFEGDEIPPLPGED